MAKAKKLPSGSWRCLVYSHSIPVIDKDGKPVIDPKTKKPKERRVYESITCDDPSPRGKREAERMAAEFAAQKDQIAKSIASMTFEEAAKAYINSRESVLSPRTIMDYRRILAHDLATLLPIRLNRLTREDIQIAINLESIRHSPKTVRNTHGLISAVLAQYRPELRLTTSLPQKTKPNLYIPNDDDIRKLLFAARDTELELPILLAAFGPMRRGEICALHSQDISGNRVHVCANMVITESHQWILKSTKTTAGDRYIDYPDFVAEKWRGINGRITQLNPNALSSRFARFLKRLDIPHFRFHDLRHYSASIQHALGIPDAYIMQRGGWSSDSTLKLIYRHALSDQTAAMDSIANGHFTELCNTKCNTTTKNP